MSALPEKRLDVEVGPPPSIDQGDLGKEIIDDKENDDALAFAAEHHVAPLTPEEDQRILRKIDRVLLPTVRLSSYSRLYLHTDIIVSSSLHIL